MKLIGNLQKILIVEKAGKEVHRTYKPYIPVITEKADPGFPKG